MARLRASSPDPSAESSSSRIASTYLFAANQASAVTCVTSLARPLKQAFASSRQGRLYHLLNLPLRVRCPCGLRVWRPRPAYFFSALSWRARGVLFVSQAFTSWVCPFVCVHVHKGEAAPGCRHLGLPTPQEPVLQSHTAFLGRPKQAVDRRSRFKVEGLGSEV